MNAASALLPALAAALLLLPAGCEGDKTSRAWSRSPSSEGVSEEAVVRSDLVGTWTITGGSATWYIHFSDDGTWRITNDREGESLRLHGTYTVDGGRFSGPLTNPGVGTGMISGTFSGNSIVLDMVQYWYSPYRHVPYTGARA